jgi:hypothetical protein
MRCDNEGCAAGLAPRALLFASRSPVRERKIAQILQKNTCRSHQWSRDVWALSADGRCRFGRKRIRRHGRGKAWAWKSRRSAIIRLISAGDQVWPAGPVKWAPSSVRTVWTREGTASIRRRRKSAAVLRVTFSRSSTKRNFEVRSIASVVVAGVDDDAQRQPSGLQRGVALAPSHSCGVITPSFSKRTKGQSKGRIDLIPRRAGKSIAKTRLNTKAGRRWTAQRDAPIRFSSARST